ncbi:hypothetical protein [Virgibacillus senegalensis]|uniref:hypothetical protein n=1 Tax=Virgibacillus senegalensis TaxID=1499679 RepID=UPI00069E1382|nr:hypothetical protein [Virgibacillus senegalensis]
MLGKLSEEDFAVLRGPFESRRQSPGNLGAMLILSIILQPILFVLAYVVGADQSIFPNKGQIFTIHLTISILLSGCSVLYAIPSIYRKQQKVQYLVTILVSQNIFTALPFLIALFFIGKERSLSEQSLMFLTESILLFGVLVFLVTCIRFYFLLKKGAYRKGTNKHKVRSNWETGIKSYLPIMTVGTVGILYLVQFLVNLSGFYDIEIKFMITLLILIFFTMLFVLPEQLVILYCKYRFESFNFNEKGDLKPMGRNRS